MALKVYVLNGIGVRNEGIYYSHEQAFTKAISLENLFEIPVIEEHQWHSETNSLVTKQYFVHNKSVYTKEDSINPIYSFLPIHSSTIFYRKIMYAMCKKAVKMYQYYNEPCPYTDEYIYSFSLTYLQELESKLKQDEFVIRFNKEIEFITKGILDTIKVLNISIPDFYHKIMTLDAKDMMLYVKTVEKRLKNHLLKNAYGATYIENF